MTIFDNFMSIYFSPFSEITSCDAGATIEDCQFGLSATGDRNDEITPYSCATLVEVHPQAPPTLEDPPNPSLPSLALPNLVVALPSECPEKPPPLLPPPRGRGLTKGDMWEMRYADLRLRHGLGWGNSGVVAKATLAKNEYNCRAVNRLARLEKRQGGGDHKWKVAVKRTKCEPMSEESICLWVHWYCCGTEHLLVVGTCN